MFCKKCGIHIPDGSEFCPKCGERQVIYVERKPEPAKKQQPKKAGKGSTVLAIIMLLVFIGIWQYIDVEYCTPEYQLPEQPKPWQAEEWLDIDNGDYDQIVLDNGLKLSFDPSKGTEYKYAHYVKVFNNGTAGECTFTYKDDVIYSCAITAYRDLSTLDESGKASIREEFDGYDDYPDVEVSYGENLSWYYVTIEIENLEMESARENAIKCKLLEGDPADPFYFSANRNRLMKDGYAEKR